MSRLSLTDDDAQARRWFAEETQKLGCSLVVDQLGNMFASRRGATSNPTPMIAMGSHLDTQPRGGRYDGILGVVAAVEVLRTFEENGYQTHHDVGVVNWTKYVLNCQDPRRLSIPFASAFVRMGCSTPSLYVLHILIHCSAKKVLGFPSR